MKKFLQRRVHISISIAIILIALTLSWRNQRTIDTLRTAQESLLTQAHSSGINLTDPLPLSSRSSAKDPLREAERVAANFIAYGRDMKGIYNEYYVAQLPPAARQRMIAQMDEIIALNGKQLEHLISTIQNAPGLDEEVRRNLLQFSLTRLGALQPAVALAIINTSPLFEEMGGYSRSIVETITTTWNAQAPDAFLSWLRKNHPTLPPATTSTITSQLSLGLSVTAPLDLFPFLQEFSPTPANYFPHILQKSTLSLADRHECLSQIRELAHTLPDPKERAEFLQKNNRALILGQLNHEADFETSTAFATSGVFTPDDLEILWNPAICDLSYHIKEEDTPRWIDWLQETFPDGQADRRIKQLLER